MDGSQMAELLAQVAALKLQVGASTSSYWPAVITGFFTLVAALSGGYLLESLRYKRQSSAVRTALIAEVKAMTKIAISRNYLGYLSDGEQGLGTFSIKIPDNYNPVYAANVQNVGMLPQADAELVVTFHQYIQSVLQDVSPGGVLAQDFAPSESFKETRGILKAAIDISGRL